MSQDELVAPPTTTTSINHKEEEEDPEVVIQDEESRTQQHQHPISHSQSPPLTPPQHAQHPPSSSSHYIHYHHHTHHNYNSLPHPHHHHHHQRSDLQYHTTITSHTDDVTDDVIISSDVTSPTKNTDSTNTTDSTKINTNINNETTDDIITDKLHHLTLSTPKSTPQPITKPLTKPKTNSSPPPFKYSHDHHLPTSTHHHQYSNSPTQISTTPNSPPTQPSSYDCSPQIPPGSPPFLSPVLSPVFSPASSMSPAMLPAGACTKRHIWLIRHGERADLADKNWAAAAAAAAAGGEGERRYDPPLTRLGVLTAYVTGKTLARMRTPGAVPQLVITSPFLRCLQTATQIARNCNGCPIAIEPGICEYIAEDLFNGVFPGPMLSQEEFVRDYCTGGPKGFIPTFVENKEWRVRKNVPEKWETRFDLQDRCRDVAEWLDSRVVRDYESIAIVTHGTCLIMLSMYLDDSKAWPSVETPYCCVSHFLGYSALDGSRPESPTPLMISDDDGDGEDDLNKSGGSSSSKKTSWKAVLICSQKHLKRK